MSRDWAIRIRKSWRRSARRHRRPSAHGTNSVRTEALETRLLLSAQAAETASPAAFDAGFYYWVGDRQVPLLVPTTGYAVAASTSASTAGVFLPTEFRSPDGSSRLWLTDQVYVRLTSAAPETLFTPENGFSGFERVLGTPDEYVATVTAGVAASLSVANALHSAAGVAFSHPNFLLEMWTHSNDPIYPSQWNLHNTGQSGGTPDADIDAPEAWAITKGSPDIVVAVLDVGTQLNHPDLVNNLFVNTGEIPGNGIDDDGNGWIDDVHGLDVAPDKNNTNQIEHDGDPSPGNQYDNHGTAVAGVIAAEADNGIGISGVAPGVKLLVVRLGESNSSGSFSITVASMAAAVYYVAGRTANGLGTWRGADVANHSYGTGSEIPAMTAAFEWAATNGRGGLGLANFVSSGNGGGSTVSFPANLSTTIAVGATGNNDVRSSYSQYGTALDFVAPGGNGPDFGYIWTTDRTGSNGYVSSDYVGMNGTSFSAPTAAGIAALMLSVDPTLTFQQVRQIMRDTADRNKVTGVTFDSSGFNLEYGYGWLNAHSAVVAAQEFNAPPPVTPPAPVTSYDDLVFQRGDGTWVIVASNGTQFTTTASAQANISGAVWGDWVSGDFNGDGREDVAARNQTTGLWTVGIVGDSGLALSTWGSWTTAKTWGSILVGDFNGDGRADIAGRIEDAGDGRWFVSLSTGSSFQTNVWGGWTTNREWGHAAVGDFNGDGKDDIVGRIENAGDGRWFVGLSDGSRFMTYYWQTWSTNVVWGPVEVGDFNGDGRADIASRVQSSTDGRWFLGLSTGSSFTTIVGNNFAPGSAFSHVHVGDFDGDGDSEIATRLAADGRWFVFNLTGSSFSSQQWGSWATSALWKNSAAGDFNGDGLFDIAGRNEVNGKWYVAISTGTSFTSSIWGDADTLNWNFAAAGEFV
ncbi:MAG: S8 family serine peptidase [Planctomycetaceae bacterium]|nr:S8 family serine peptidase [Planctomycetaceae bacterium]